MIFCTLKCLSGAIIYKHPPAHKAGAVRPGYNHIIISVGAFKSAAKPLFTRVSVVSCTTLPRRFTTLPRSFTTLPRLIATLPRLLQKSHFRVRPWVQGVGFLFPGATIYCFFGHSSGVATLSSCGTSRNNSSFKALFAAKSPLMPRCLIMILSESVFTVGGWNTISKSL